MEMPMSRTGALRARRATALALLALTTPGCRTWRAQPLPDASAPERVIDGRVRAVRTDGSRVELVGARIGGDTLRGEQWQIGRDGRRVAVAVPLDSVERVERRAVSKGRTAALVGGIVVGLVLVLGALLAAATFPAY
jgi:hypothetical protein